MFLIRDLVITLFFHAVQMIQVRFDELSMSYYNSRNKLSIIFGTLAVVTE